MTIEPRKILDCYAQVRTRAEAVVVEGVGGFRVPLTDDYDTADLARDIGLPVVLVVGLRLGCISHALLTAEAIVLRVPQHFTVQAQSASRTRLREAGFEVSEAGEVSAAA